MRWQRRVARTGLMRRTSTRSGPRVAGGWIRSIGETSLVAPCSACLASCARRGGREGDARRGLDRGEAVSGQLGRLGRPP